MERKIGEIFEYEGKWYQCVEGLYCYDCAFVNDNCEDRERITLREKLTKQPVTGFCNSEKRNDRKSVIFKKLEKVGEPYEFDGHLFQSYRTFEVPIFTENYATVRELGNNSKISIEIKQNKEDMEENGNNRTNCEECGDKRFEVIARAKAHLLETTNIASDEKEMAVIDNILFRCYQMGWLERYEEKTKELDLKPFDIQKAREGKPVCTIDGGKARIICFDRNDLYPIVALIECENGKEMIGAYSKEGHTDIYEIKGTDLMMLPEKKEGWAKVRKDINIYDTKEEADRKMIGNDEYVTAKVCWEE